MLQIVTGDLFEAKEQYIAHQCNCITTKGAHLSAAMFARFPHANIYRGRAKPDEPGTIIVRGGNPDERLVINMLAQFYPGKPKFPDSPKDGYAARQSYFRDCLEKISNLRNLQSIAFPYQIGCGAAGGSWPAYLNLLQEFAAKTSAKVMVYKLPF